jgi:hypothetical protein
LTEDNSPYNKIDVDQLNEERRKRDCVSDLPEGFSLKAHGRSGYIYYKEKGKLVEVYCELSGVPEYHFLTSSEDFKTWALPKKEPVPEEKRKEIEDNFRRWVAKNKWRTDF